MFELAIIFILALNFGVLVQLPTRAGSETYMVLTILILDVIFALGTGAHYLGWWQ